MYTLSDYKQAEKHYSHAKNYRLYPGYVREIGLWVIVCFSKHFCNTAILLRYFFRFVNKLVRWICQSCSLSFRHVSQEEGLQTGHTPASMSIAVKVRKGGAADETLIPDVSAGGRTARQLCKVVLREVQWQHLTSNH